MMNKFLQEYLPQNYKQVSQERVNIDGEKAALTRYQKDKTPTLGGEHFSTVTDSKNTLKGSVYLDKKLVIEILVTEQQAEKIANDFLEKYAPRLIQK